MTRFVFSSEDGGDLIGRAAWQPPSKINRRRYGHFEILVGAEGTPLELGFGAMGTTYRAYDMVLHTTVALKVIRQDLAASAEVRAHFLREARAAARLRHPNVASVFHYGEQDGECFYAMELVEGETLEERVQRSGPLPVNVVLEIAVQVTHALVAAGALAMVHRDLKPSNIMLETVKTPGGGDTFIVKVIDFGLAKAIAADGEAAGAGVSEQDFAGTPAFASPEQLARYPARRVDTRSDIYSLGVTLWYLLTGQLPFPDSTISELRARHQPGFSLLPLEQLKTVRVPKPCVKLLRSMLAVAPESRPRNAPELYEALCRCRKPLPSITESIQKRPRLYLAASVTAFVTLIAGIFLWWNQPGERTPPTERSVAVLPFDNLPATTANEFYSAQVRDGIIADLVRVADLKVIGAESARSYSPGNRGPSDIIGRELGVRYLLGGSVRRTSSSVQVEVWLNDTINAAPLWVVRYDHPSTDVFALQGEIARAVATRLDARLTPREREEIGRPPTTDPVAYDLYSRARETGSLVSDTGLARYRQYASLVPLLEEAIKRDPNFALAYCELATVQDNLYYCQISAPPDEQALDHRAKADAALAQGRRLQPDAGELHLAQATHFVRTGLENEQARIEIDLARERLPNSAQVEEMAGEIARRANRWEEAIHCLERAVILEPRDSTCRLTLANTFRFLRRYDEARHQLDQLIAVLPDRLSGSFRIDRELVTLEQRADIVQVRTAVEEICRQQPGADSTNTYHLLLALDAHDADEVGRILAATDRNRFLISRVPYPKAWFEALAARMRGDQAGARAAFLVARAEMEKTVQANAGDGQMLGLLAMIDAGLGEKDAATREAQRACELYSVEKLSIRAPAVAMNLAVVYAWTGQPELACRVIGKWIERPAGMVLPVQPTYGDLELNPVWDPIRNRPEFIALAARLSPRSAP